MSARLLGRLARGATDPRRIAGLVRLARRMTGRARGTGSSPLAAARRIVVVRLDAIGDVVLTTPFLRELRRNAPGARITLVVDRAAFELVETCPFVDRVLAYDRPRPRRRERPTLVGHAARFAARHLWADRPDLALVPRWGWDWPYAAAFVAAFSGAPERAGFATPPDGSADPAHPAHDPLYTRCVRDERIVHDAERPLALLEHLGGTVGSRGLEVWPSADDERLAAQLLASRGAASGPLVAFGIGAGDPARRWPAARYAELAVRLRDAVDASLLVVGDPSDGPAAATVAAAVPGRVVDATGRLGLRATFAALRACDLAVCNDSAPLHLAAAAGLPVVEMSRLPEGRSPLHPNAPERFGPFLVPHRVVRPGPDVADDAAALRSIGVDRAFAAVLELRAAAGRR